MRENETRLVIEIDKNLHYIIKKLALDHRVTIKDWILDAIATKMNEYEELNEIK